MSDVLVGAIDPITAFNSQVRDLIEITDAFESGTSEMTALDYLRIGHTVQENLSALVTATVASIMSSAVHSDKVSSEDMATHHREVEDNHTDDENERIGRALNRIAKHFTVDSDDGNPEETPDVS